MRDERFLISASLDQTVRRWDVTSGQALNRIELQKVPVALSELEETSEPGTFPKLAAVRGGTVEKVSVRRLEVPMPGPDMLMQLAAADIAVNEGRPWGDPMPAMSERELSVGGKRGCEQLPEDW
jgi:hypothetical protein